jgi:hypothetical protein
MKKRGRGRPKLPPEYWRDLVSLGEYSEHVPEGLTPHRYEGWNIRNIPRLGLSEACRRFVKDGALLRWTRNGVTIAEISDWKTLQARIIEARRRPEAVKPRLVPVPQQRPEATTFKWMLPPRSTVLWRITNKGKLPIRGGIEIRYQSKPHVRQLITRSLHKKYE